MAEAGSDRIGEGGARVEQTGVHTRPRRAVPDGGRTSAIAAVVVIGIVAALWGLRSNPAQTAEASEQPASTLVGAPSVAPGPTTDTPISTPVAADPATAGPAAAGTAMPEPGPSSARPTQTATAPKPTLKPQKTPRPNPDPTDAPHPTWSPPAVFSATVWFERQCLDGTTYDMVFIEWASPIPIDDIHLWLNDEFRGVTWFASGGGPQYESRHGSSQSLTYGTTYVASAAFFDENNNVVAGRIDSDPYTPTQPDDPC